jgi:hypothetical protein
MIEVAVKIDNWIYKRKMKQRGIYTRSFRGYNKKKKAWAKKRYSNEIDINNVNLTPKPDWKKKT